MSFSEQSFVLSFAAAFQKAAAMDFYITQYQSKPLESMTLLFQAMALGIRRLEQKEAEEQSVRTELQAAAVLDNTAPELPRRGGRRILEDLANRARRLCIRMASQPCTSCRTAIASRRATTPPFSRGSCSGRYSNSSAS